VQAARRVEAELQELREAYVASARAQDRERR
jgi:hypothetical protein